MSDVVLAALIGAIASIIVNLIAKAGESKKRAVAEAVKEANLESRLSSIENKLDTHNGYAEKIGGIQEDISKITLNIAVMANDIKNLYKRGE